MKPTCGRICLLLAALATAIPLTSCVKTRTVTQGGRVVSQGPVVVSPIRGTTIRSHEDRR